MAVPLNSIEFRYMGGRCLNGITFIFNFNVNCKKWFDGLLGKSVISLTELFCC